MNRSTTRGRPQLFTRYADEMAIFNTTSKRVAFGVLMVVALIIPFSLGRSDALLATTALTYAIGALGLNLISGYAGQVSLGHAFFAGIGAYTAVFISSPAQDGLIGLGITNPLVWMPVAGLVAALVGYLVAPLATRLRGLYLGIVTLGLVFLGEHIWRDWLSLTGGDLGRKGVQANLFGLDFNVIRGEIFGVTLGREQRQYFLALFVLVVLGFMAKNLARSRTGRSFSAIRDQDVAAEVMGVNLNKTKRTAFAISSFYAGVAGAMLALIASNVVPVTFNLLLSILFIAMILVGGPATISGSILGALVVGLLPRLIEPISALLTSFIGLFSSGDGSAALPLNSSQLQQVFYGGMLIIFLIAEPRGLYGLWLRVRNYWKAFPFSF